METKMKKHFINVFLFLLLIVLTFACNKGVNAPFNFLQVNGHINDINGEELV